ncbi:hypothetical protein QBC99_003376 [Beijerinckia sp. GAS462]|nr:hypothetical protein [Beijerinckia sp. GAS462]SEC80584.1 hypothetical protein SAMN05443249_3607 [Beijerinckia sp. 28-YEA-48]
MRFRGPTGCLPRRLFVSVASHGFRLDLLYGPCRKGPRTACKPFSMTFQTYVPKDVVNRVGWQPAPIAKVAN